MKRWQRVFTYQMASKDSGSQSIVVIPEKVDFSLLNSQKSLLSACFLCVLCAGNSFSLSAVPYATALIMVTDVEVTGSEHSADRSGLIDAWGPPPVDPSNEVRIIDSLNARRGPNRVMMLNHFERRVLLGRGQHGEVFEGLDTDKNTLVVRIRGLRFLFLVVFLIFFTHFYYRPSKL